MTRIIKLGDPIYAQSLRKLSASALGAFPQREQFLREYVRGVEFEVFHHEVIQDIADVWRERSRLIDYLAGHRFDWIMVDNPISALVAGGADNASLLFDCIDWYDEVYLKEFGVDKRYYLLRYGLLDLLDRAKKVIAQSPVILSALKAWGLKTSDTVVIPNGYDDRLFYPYPRERVEKARADICGRFGFDFDGKKLIVFSGRITAASAAIKTVVEALEGDQVLLIVGDGPLLQEIPDGPSVIKCGAVPVEEVPKFTNAADVLVFPVESDCSPIVVSEYMAIGKPIVMPKGRIDWLLKDGENACLVDANSYSWRRGIRRAIEQSERLGTQNRILARELRWPKLAEKFAAFVQ